MIFNEGYLSIQNYGWITNLAVCEKLYFTKRLFFFTNCFPGNTSSIRTCIELANHPKTIHKVTKPYMCVIYGFKFNIISRLEAHTRKHTGEKPYDTCSENFVIQEFKFHHHGHLQEKQYEYSIWKKKRKYSTHFLWNNN